MITDPTPAQVQEIAGRIEDNARGIRRVIPDYQPRPSWQRIRIMAGNVLRNTRRDTNPTQRNYSRRSMRALIAAWRIIERG